MIWFAIIAAAVTPGISLLAYFYLKDRYDPEPVSLVIKVFVIGALLVFPLMVFQRAMVLGFGENPLLFSFVYSAGMEEILKWSIVYHFIYKHVHFDEPYDGIVYAVAVSLGFATLENVFFSVFNYSSFSNLMFRAFLPVSGHALFGVVMGYYIGKAKFSGGREKILLTVSIFVPILIHGLFDYILIVVKLYWIWIAIPLMILLWAWSLRKVHKANARSPLRTVYREEKIKWPTTGP